MGELKFLYPRRNVCARCVCFNGQCFANYHPRESGCTIPTVQSLPGDVQLTSNPEGGQIQCMCGADALSTWGRVDGGNWRKPTLLNCSLWYRSPQHCSARGLLPLLSLRNLQAFTTNQQILLTQVRCYATTSHGSSYITQHPAGL